MVVIEDNEVTPGSVPIGNPNHERTAACQKPIRTPHIEPPYIEEECYNFSIRVGDTVEVKDTSGRLDKVLHSGDFLYIKHILRNLETDKIKLRGYRMSRTKYHGQIFNSKHLHCFNVPSINIFIEKLNELVMILHVNIHDTRSPLDQGMEDIDPADIVRKRDCLLTSKPYPLGNYKQDPVPAHFSTLTQEEQKSIVFHQGKLVCRYVFIMVDAENRKNYEGEIRNLYSHECATKPRVTSHSRKGLARETSITIDDDDDEDLVLIEKRQYTQKRKRRERSESVTKSDMTPPKRRPKLPQGKRIYTFGDAFCGAGGASEGARQAGFYVMWGLDKNEAALLAYGANFSNADVYLMDAHNFSDLNAAKQKLKIDCLHLSPPCCFWSIAQ